MSRKNLSVVDPNVDGDEEEQAAPADAPQAQAEPEADLSRFVTIFDAQYEARSCKYLSTKERLRYYGIQNGLRQASLALGEYTTAILEQDTEALDFETPEPPPELVEAYEFAYLRLVRWAFPEVPMTVWDDLRARSFDYVEMLGDRFTAWANADAIAMREGEQSGPPVIRLPRSRPSPA